MQFFFKKSLQSPLRYTQENISVQISRFIIDNKLNLAARIVHVNSKISKCVGTLMKDRSCLSR